jgi:hypothetical protein
VFVYGNRKTTASTTLHVGSSPITGRNQLGAGNDNDKAETFLAIVTGSVTLQEGGEFSLSVTLRGGVGASGDVVVITRIVARVQLRRLGDIAEVAVFERGVAEYFARGIIVPVPGGAPHTCHSIRINDIANRSLRHVCITGVGTDVTAINYRVAVVAPIHFTFGFSEDWLGEGFLEWVSIVVWG